MFVNSSRLSALQQWLKDQITNQFDDANDTEALNRIIEIIDEGFTNARKGERLS